MIFCDKISGVKCHLFFCHTKRTCSKAPLEIGGGVTLTEVIELMKAVASENEAYKYGKTVVDHLNVVSIYFLPDNMYNNIFQISHIFQVWQSLF